MGRTVEVFTGAYASGKSESAVNRALQYVKAGESITLVDFDTVEPAYCIRPLKKELDALGVTTIAQSENFGLGETGSYVTAEQVNCLKRAGNVIIDVGYGASGLDTLEVITDIEKEENLKIYLVLNTSKFETHDVESILEYIDFASGLKKRPWKKFAGLISNTHFAQETTYEDITRGYEIIKKASKQAGIPIIAIGADEKFTPDFKNAQYDNVPVWFYKRFMPKALW
jgi:hypothetical protein